MKHLHAVFIRPSCYDDDGYVVRFARGVLPSSTVDRLRQLSRADSHLSSPVRRKLQKKATEVESYLKGFDVQA